MALLRPGWGRRWESKEASPVLPNSWKKRRLTKEREGCDICPSVTLPFLALPSEGRKLWD